jgi:hypothetical protein
VPVVSLPVDFGGGRSEPLHVFAGQSVERVVTTFAAKWRINDPVRLCRDRRLRTQGGREGYR